MRRPYAKRTKRPKPDVFAPEYIAQGFNGAATVRYFKPHLTEVAARVEASQTLAKPEYKHAIQEALENAGLNEGSVTKEHAKVIKQNEHLPAKNTAIDMFYKLQGSYAPDRSITANITVPYDIDKALKDIAEEIKKISQNK